MTTSSDNSDAEEPRRTPKKPTEPPVMPTAAEARAMRPAAQVPAPVRHAFVAWLLAGLLAVGNGVLLLINKQQLIDNAIRDNRNPNITNDQIVQGTTTLVWVLLVGSVVFAALFTLCAYKAQDGVRRARRLLTVLCVITTAFYFLILPTNLGMMAALLGVAATIMLYLPKAGEYFRPRELPA